MRSLTKLVIVLAVIAALIYGGTQAYLRYEIKKGVDEAIKQAAPVAEITYREIFVSPNLDGEVGVDGIVIKPVALNDTVKVESVRLHYPDIIALVGALSELKKREFPEQMLLSISGVKVALNGALLTSLDQAQKQARALEGDSRSLRLQNFDALGCGDISAIGIDELLHMGYQTLEFNIDMRYDYERLKNLLKTSLTFRFKDMYGIDIKAELKANPAAGVKGINDSLILGTGALPSLSELKITYLDSGFNLLRNRFCAARLNSTEEFYVAQNLEALSQSVGAVFPEESMESYKKFLAGSGNFTFTMAPAPGADLATLGSYPLQDLIDVLNLKLSINEQQVKFSKFEWGKSYSAPTMGGAERRQGENVVELTAPKIQQPAQYHTVAVNKLGRYVGSQAKIQTLSGTLREGIIESTDNESVTIRLLSARDKGKGYIAFPIYFNEINSAKVLYAE